MRARDVRASALLALLAGCSAAPSDHSESTRPPPPLDAPIQAEMPALSAESAEDRGAAEEPGLAEYERLLADKEARLQAAGVLIARRDDANRDRAGDAVDTRFAQPPPGPSPPRPTATTKTARKSPSKAAPAGAAQSSPVLEEPKPAEPTPRPLGKAKTDAPADRAPNKRAEAEKKVATVDRCESICDLADTTCDLETKICDLAGRHPDDPRYGDLCRRADEDCEAAAAACQRCT